MIHYFDKIYTDDIIYRFISFKYFVLIVKIGLNISQTFHAFTQHLGNSKVVKVPMIELMVEQFLYCHTGY